MIKLVAARAGHPVITREPQIVTELPFPRRFHGVERDGGWEWLTGFTELLLSERDDKVIGSSKERLLSLPEPPRGQQKQDNDKPPNTRCKPLTRGLTLKPVMICRSH